MDYREATDRIAALNITQETIAEAQGTALNMVARARLDPSSADYRKPPAGWQAAVAKLARTRAAQLVKLAEQLDKGSRMTTITMQTLIERINERLEPQSQRLIKTTPINFDQSVLGDYFLKDMSKATTVEADVDPVKLGRALGVLHEMERVEDRPRR